MTGFQPMPWAAGLQSCKQTFMKKQPKQNSVNLIWYHTMLKNMGITLD